MEHQDAAAALTQYFNIGLQQFNTFEQIRNIYFGPTRRVRVLDFACGYGRLLRFLTARRSLLDITAAELQKDALEFVSKEFDINALQSFADPVEFKAEGKFDLIWVASLFSHLPDHLFTSWLNKLLGLVAPGGILCFSVRDAALLTHDTRMSKSGVYYLPQSEDGNLSTDYYGTTWVTEQFVRECIDGVGERRLSTLRLPRMLANEQDLYIVSEDSQRVGSLKEVRRGAWGWLDRKDMSGGLLQLEGWAASLDPTLVRRVEVFIDGHLFPCAVGGFREDVAEVFGEDRLKWSGWSFSQNIGSEPSAYLEVICPDPDSPALIFSGPVSWLRAAEHRRV